MATRTWDDMTCGRGPRSPVEGLRQPAPGEVLGPTSRAPQPHSAVRHEDLPHWAVRPQWHMMAGRWMELYGTGALALALGRSSGTVRRWEALGVRPPPRYVRNTRTWGGRRRLYTRLEIEAMADVIERRGLLRRRPQELCNDDLGIQLRGALAQARGTADSISPCSSQPPGFDLDCR